MVAWSSPPGTRYLLWSIRIFMSAGLSRAAEPAQPGFPLACWQGMPLPSMPETSAQATTDNASLWRPKHALSIFCGWAQSKTSHDAQAFRELACLPPTHATARAARGQQERQNPSSAVPPVQPEHAD